MTFKSLRIFFVLFCVVYISAYNQSNNVCKTFVDYYKDRDNNKNCYYNPDLYLQVPEIIQRYGYPVKIYTVTTQDGYILTIFRIPHGRNSSEQQLGSPVFIQHGIGVSSVVFVNIGKKSLAFTLADNGYDVWLGNFRGTEYSNKHMSLNYTDKNYWNFTFHENGIYDLPAQLNLVSEVTKQKIVYIGYSMGTTAYFVYNVEYPDIARQKIKVAISLAPIAFVHYVETALKFVVPLWSSLQNRLFDLTGGAISQRTPETVKERATRCLPYPSKMRACQYTGHLLYGFDASQDDAETFPIITLQDSDAIGIKTISHYIQLIRSRKFQQFDYGKNNKEVYGTLSPPLYNLSKINLPNYFIRGNNDPLATKKNTEETYNSLPKVAKSFGIFVIKYREFTHADFITAKDVKQLLYDHIVKFIKSSENVIL